MKQRLHNFVCGMFAAVAAILFGMAVVVTFVAVATCAGNLQYAG